MKTKLLFAGLVASAALVGCTNDELIETTGSGVNAAKGETTLVFDGMGGIDTKMTYENGKFKWEVDDEIGVRRVSGDIVISNTMFKVRNTSDENVGDPSKWDGTEPGAFAFFESNDETLHEADYIVTFPYDKKSVQDGKVIGRLPVAQVANQNDGTAYGNNEYAGDYGFMMSTATHMKGGQNTEHFTLYPVFSRLRFNITESTSLDDVMLQSIILESKDGSAIFPTELEVGADVKVAADGYLDPSYMTSVESSKVSQIVLTTANEKLSADKAVEKYMTIIPGTYKNIQVRINTNKGYFIFTPKGDITQSTGRATTPEIDITDLDPYTEYVVASQVDWTQALGNIAAYLSDNSGNPSIGNTSTIRVMGDVTIAADKFRAAAMSTKHTINVVGDGSITIDGDLNQRKDDSNLDDPTKTTATLGIMNFNVPVTVKGDFKEVAEGDQLTFAELNVVGGTDNIGEFNPNNSTNFKSIVVKKGVVTGTTTYRTTAADAALTMENVAFAGKVTVSAMTATGNDAAKKTTKVNFNNCSFTGGLDVADSWQGTTAVTVNGGSISNQAGNATLTVGTDNSSTKTNVLYVKGNVTADIVDVQKVYSGNVIAEYNSNSVLDIIGSLTVNKEVKNSDNSKIMIQQDATLTVGEKAVFEVENANTLIEGTLVNNGLITVNNGVELTDIEHNNKHLGVITNNGSLWAPAAKWYENQYIDVNNAGSYEYVISGITSADLTSALAGVVDVNKAEITGVELTASTYNFKENADYSAYDLYVTAATTLVAPGCKFGDLTVRVDAVTLDNGKASTTEFGDVAIESGKLSIDNTTGAATTLKCADMSISRGATLEHADQLDCANEAWSDGNTGTIIWD